MSRPASKRKSLSWAARPAPSGQVSAAPNSYLPYRASKAGLHLIARNLGQYLAPSGILVALINPGLVDTRGVLDRKPGDPVPEEFVSILPLIEKGIIRCESPADAVANMLARIDQLGPDDVGEVPQCGRTGNTLVVLPLTVPSTECCR